MSMDLENMLSHESKRAEFIQLKRCFGSGLIIKRDDTRDLIAFCLVRYVIVSDSQKLKAEIRYVFNSKRY